MEYQKLVIESNGDLLICRISDPPANLVGQALLRELDRFLDETLDGGRARAVILTATGDVFSGGGNLVDQSALYWNGRASEDLGNHVFNRIERYPLPVIAAVQGDVFGGGVELLMSCHLRVMSASAKLKMPELQFGFVPGWGGTQRLPRIVGRTRAYEMYLTADAYTAEQMHAFGLVNRVAPAGAALQEAQALAERTLRSSPEAIAAFIQVVNQSADQTLDVGLEIEHDAVLNTVSSPQLYERVIRIFPKLGQVPRSIGQLP